HPRLGGRGPDRLHDPAAAGDAAAGLEPRREACARLLCRLAEVAGQRCLRQRLQGTVGAVHPPRLRGRALQAWGAGGCQGRAARRMCAAELARAALDRRWADQGLRRREAMNKPVLPASSHQLKLPKADGSLETYRLAASRTFPAKLAGTLNRVAFSAVHVVADPLADVDPWLSAAIDWDKTIAFREHVWDLGLGVAEAM